ncbi:uncharacterized protein [Prorops nasuta]|uniref:uncharacterized protein n=1 Tax=Prorops nasuta TaxID=863751 RepID=UPI0034CF53AE
MIHTHWIFMKNVHCFVQISHKSCTFIHKHMAYAYVLREFYLINTTLVPPVSVFSDQHKMATRVQLLLQKRSTLRSQIVNLERILDKGKIDRISLRLRMRRLEEQFYSFEEDNNELAILEPDQRQETEFIDIQDKYYALASRVDSILLASDVSSHTDSGSYSGEGLLADQRENVNIGRRIKLPEIALPKFDGKYENWLAFKNAFKNLIISQNDLTETDKLHYLKSALIEDASQKLNILSIAGTDFNKAWNLLEKSYEVKRVLISQHLTMILELPAMTKDTTCGYSKLADDMQQHIAALDALGVKFTPELAVHILETKLTKGALKEWEATLEREEFPTVEKMYEFLYKAASRVAKGIL